MGETILINGALVSISKTDFDCPSCGHTHHEDDWYPKLNRSRQGQIYMLCKDCKQMLGVTVDMRGDVHAWLKKDEKNYE